MQIAFGHAGFDLSLAERASAAVCRPGSPPTARQDRGCALRDARENISKHAIERNDRLAAMPALARGEHDGVILHV
jgi:hypothetical protein